MLSVGSLCTGYGGLEMGLQTVYSDIDLRFVSDIDKDVNTLLAHHHPNVPNLGDLTVVDWSDIEPVDVLCAGYPCQPFSHAGYRKGNNDERAIFEYIGDAISVLRPRNVLLENVSGHLTLGGTTVIAILTRLGYDAKWGIVRASDASAPHQRKRLFIWCQSTYTDSTRRKRQSQKRSVGFNKNVPERTQTRYRHFTESDGTCIERFNFRQYEQAIRRWEAVMGRIAPTPVDDKGVNPVFVEWVMGLPEGHVTSLDISRAGQLKMLGNGVVPQQAALALQLLAEGDYYAKTA